MHSLSELIKEIRLEADLTQPEFADALGVSPALIAMIETGHKEVSKKLILILAERLEVHPSSITPFIYLDEHVDGLEISKLEKQLSRWGEKMQDVLIRKKAHRLRKYVSGKNAKN